MDKESYRYRAYYNQPEPIEFDVDIPDPPFDGPVDELDYLLDAAPFSKQRAVRVERIIEG